jgi:predicted RNase H-like HicB family nuclease
MSEYIALIDGSPGAFGAVFPDLPGCTSGGATLDEVYRNAIEAVRLWAEDARSDGEDLPEPRDMQALRSEPRVAKALAEGSVLALIPLREHLVARIDL